MELTTGYHPNLKAADYHSSHAISSSALVHALRSPAHFWVNYIGNPDRTPQKETPALNFGRAAHAFLLEPDSFRQTFRIAPEVNKRTNEGKAIFKDFMDAAAADGAEVITSDDLQLIAGMATALGQYEIEDSVGRVITMSDIFKRGKAEESFVWKDPDTGLLLRARTDWRIGNIVIDYKTCRDARPMPFRREVAMRRYYMRAAMYMDGIEAVTGTRPDAFYLIAQEKEAPFATAAYQINSDNLAFGQQQYMDALKSIARCMESGKWTGYSRHVQVITVPDYLYDENVQ